MAKRDTKQTIADAFASAVKESSLSQVKIADLISTLAINRNTFYYHFSSKYDVALWIFRCALARELRASLPERNLVSAPFKEGDEEALPYWVHIEIGARTLDCAPFFKALARCVLADADFYRKLFCVRETEFMTLAMELWRPVICDDVAFILDKRYLPEATRRLLVDATTRLVVGGVEYILENRHDAETLLDDRANPFWNILHESIAAAIQAHPVNRKTPPRNVGSAITGRRAYPIGFADTPRSSDALREYAAIGIR